MKSKLLEKYGLKNYISGSEYSISYKKEGIKVLDYVDDLYNKLGMVPLETYTAFQVHGDNINYCDGRNGFNFIFGKIFFTTDGLVTDKDNIGLMIKFADCSPIVIYDPVLKVQSILHSGWRGTVKKISKKAIDLMVNDFGSSKENLLAYIGPSIDIDSYEVGQEVYDAFSDFKSRDEFFYKKGSKYHLSMVDANLSLLLEEGINPKKIEVCRTSTYTSKEFHSSRRDGPKYGLNSMITIMT